MDAALQYDYQAPLDFDLLQLAGEALRVGDTVVAEGLIPLPITEVRDPVAGFIVARYDGVIPGFRLYCPTQILSVLRKIEQPH